MAVDRCLTSRALRCGLFIHRRRLYWNALVVWFVSLVILALVARRKGTTVGPLIAFTIALVAIGLFMIISTCLLVEYIPRYGMPMWQLLLLSIWILVRTAADLALSPSSAPKGVPSKFTRDFNRALRERELVDVRYKKRSTSNAQRSTFNGFQGFAFGFSRG